MNPLPTYRYGAARTMVHLHGQYLQEGLAAWQAAKTVSIVLPETDNPAYVSLETLLQHMLSAAGSYMVWICDKLELPDPQIRKVPPLAMIESEAEGYLAHIIDRWAMPLSEVDEDRFYRPEYRSNWGVLYCVDAMLEHAVMHAIQHRLQLEELIEEQAEPFSEQGDLMPTAQPIPEAFHELLASPVLMSLATTLGDGTIQLTPVWFNYDGGYIYFNSEKDRLKHRIIRKRPGVSLIILDPDNKARWLAVRGTVVEMTDDVDREHANALTMKYMGVPQFGAPPEEQRVRFKICPEHVAAAELYAPPPK